MSAGIPVWEYCQLHGGIMSPVSLKDTLCHQLSSTGLKQEDVYNIIRDVDRWSVNSGPEWTIDRLKALKNELVTRMGGEPHLAPWVRRSHGGSPSGAWGKLVTPGHRPKQIQKRLACLMIYTDFKRSPGQGPTRKQLDKFLPAVHSEPVSAPLTPQDVRIDRVNTQPLKWGHRRLITDPTADLRLAPSRRAPIIDGDRSHVHEPTSPLWELGYVDKRRLDRPKRSVRETDVSRWYPSHAYSEAVREMRDASPQFDLWISSLEYLRTGGRDRLQLMKAERRIAGKSSLRTAAALLRSTTIDTSGDGTQERRPDLTGKTVGAVSLLQEPGYKLRSVANPNRLLQAWLRPLQLCLFEHLREIEQDFTFNQDMGIEVVQGWLRDGARVHSVDLSSATDRFPLDYQLNLALMIGGHDSEFVRDIGHFAAIARARWQMPPNGFGVTSVTWTNGQPLGLGPSFALFALAHHNVVREFTQDYVILGDDIVIKGNEAADKYKAKIRSLGCEISETKTMSSDRVAEFAGRVITPERVYSQPKWKDPSDRSFLNFVENMGPSALLALRPRQRRVAQVLLAVPKEYGGLGLNPDGIPLGERLEMYSALADSIPDVTPREPVIGRQIALSLALQEPFWSPKEHEARGPIDKIVRPLGSTVKEQVILYHRPHTVLDPDEMDLPGYVLGVSTSDPRGRTALEIWEGRLKNVTQSWAQNPAMPDRGKRPNNSRTSPRSRPDVQAPPASGPYRQPPTRGGGLGR